MAPDDGFKRLLPDYHLKENEFREDASAPVLVFELNATWYFGGELDMLPEGLCTLQLAGSGHRVNGMEDGDAAALHEWIVSIGPSGASHSRAIAFGRNVPAKRACYREGFFQFINVVIGSE